MTPTDYSQWTADQVASAIIAAGQARKITPRGIQIALATELVESNGTIYSNPADPPSEQICPNCPDSFDGSSTGAFQQQAFDEWGGATYAGTQSRMDPTASADHFYDHMLTPNNAPNWVLPVPNLDYNDTSYTPGQVAQNVQRSQFPTRYDQRFSDAVALYNRLAGAAPVPTPPSTDPRLVLLQAARPDFNEFPNWGPNSEDRHGTTVDLFLRHTEENSGYDSALGLSNFLIASANTNNPVSYHRTISKGQNDDGVTVVDCVPLDQAAWAVGNSNLRSINVCFAGSSVNWTRAEWIAKLGRCIDVAGYLTVQDWINCGGVGAPPVCAGPAYGLNPPVVSDHRYCTDWLKDGNTHVDVGDNYPWDLDAAAVAKYWAIANAAAPTPVPVPTPTPTPAPVPAFVYPSTDDMIKQVWEQLFGPESQGFATLFGMTADGSRGKFTVEAIADLHKQLPAS